MTVSIFQRPEAVLDATPLQGFLTYRLARLTSRLNRQTAAILRRSGGLKIPEWRVMALLAAHGELNARAIETLSGADPGLLSRTIRALEAGGVISSRRSEGDRRTVFCSLTGKGNEMVAATAPAMRARQLLLLSALSPAERAMIFPLLDKLETAAEARDFREDER